jgi:hypothetical protein
MVALLAASFIWHEGRHPQQRGDDFSHIPHHMKPDNGKKGGCIMEKRNYRRKYGTSKWHWCKNCSDFPKEDYTIRHYAPNFGGDLCDECKKLEDEGKCDMA